MDDKKVYVLKIKVGGEKYEITPRRWVSRLLTEYAIYNFEDFKHLVYPQTELDHDNDYDGAGGDDDNR